MRRNATGLVTNAILFVGWASLKEAVAQWDVAQNHVTPTKVAQKDVAQKGIPWESTVKVKRLGTVFETDLDNFDTFQFSELREYPDWHFLRSLVYSLFYEVQIGPFTNLL